MRLFLLLLVTTGSVALTSLCSDVARVDIFIQCSNLDQAHQISKVLLDTEQPPDKKVESKSLTYYTFPFYVSKTQPPISVGLGWPAAHDATATLMTSIHIKNVLKPRWMFLLGTIMGFKGTCEPGDVIGVDRAVKIQRIQTSTGLGAAIQSWGPNRHILQIVKNPLLFLPDAPWTHGLALPPSNEWLATDYMNWLDDKAKPDPSEKCTDLHKRYIDQHKTKIRAAIKDSLSEAIIAAQERGFLTADGTITETGQENLKAKRRDWGYNFGLPHPDFRTSPSYHVGAVLSDNELPNLTADVIQNLQKQSGQPKLMARDRESEAFMYDMHDDISVLVVKGVAGIEQGWQEDKFEEIALSNAAIWLKSFIHNNASEFGGARRAAITVPPLRQYKSSATEFKRDEG